MIENIVRFYSPGITIFRNSSTKNKIGGSISNWQKHLEIEGLIRPLSGREQDVADKPTYIATHRLYCAPADILETDRVKDINGIEYDIHFVSDVMNMGNHLQIDLEQRR